MKKTIKQIISSLMVVAILLTAAPLSGFVGLELPDWFRFYADAESTETCDSIYSGTYGDNITYEFNVITETLTLSGFGAMADSQPSFHDVFFVHEEASIKNVIIENGITTIGDEAFYQFADLKSVTIPDSVTSIGVKAFYGCKSLESITIPDSVTLIGGGAFQDCYNLGSITLPSDITSISAQTFASCQNLTSIIIPDSVTTIENSAFSGCLNLIDITIPDSVATIDYRAFYNTAYYNNTNNWVDGVLYIDKFLIEAKEILSGEYIIKEGTITISYGAFNGQSNLSSITIPDSVTSIDNYAFYNCTNLKEVNISDISAWCNISFDADSSNPIANGADLILNGNKVNSLKIPDGIKKINDYAFYNYKSITSVTIPDSVTEIGDYAFYDCSNLVNIIIPDGVKSIGTSAFQYCRNLKDLILPDGLTVIEDCAFWACEGITSISIPQNIAEIGIEAFYYTGYYNNEDNWEKQGRNEKSLYIDGCLIAVKTTNSTFTIKEGTKLIGRKALSGCGIKAVTIPDSVTFINDYAFHNCSLLREVTIPDGVTRIGKYSFSECDNISSVTIPNSVTSIDSHAFERCYDLKSVIIPASITFLGDYVFAHCINMKSATVLCNADIGNAVFRQCSNLENVTIGNCVKSIGSYAFYGCARLTNVNMGVSLTFIDDYAFYDCSNLVKITVPDSVTSIGKNAFYRCENLTKITIGNSVTTIGSDAFAYCQSIENIVIPDNVKTIGSRAFYYCRYLNTVTIPESVTSIGANAFDECENIKKVKIFDISAWCKINFYNEYSNPLNCGADLVLNGEELTELAIPEDITKIKSYVFYCCTSLTSVVIHDNVTAIGSYAFALCPNIAELTMPTSATIHMRAFWVHVNEVGSFADQTITIPKIVLTKGNGTVQNFVYRKSTDRANYIYYGAFPWRYSSTVVIEDGVKYINEAMFLDAQKLTEIIIPNSVISIGADAFKRCDSITEITLPEGVKTIDTGAFWNCSNLTNVTIPESVTSIGEEAFYYCTSLAEIVLPDNLKEINKDTFNYCKNLQNVTFGKNLTIIDENAFYGCESLNDLIIPDSVLSIESNAFKNCSGLVELNIPISATNKGFYNCKNIKKITLTKGNGTVPDYSSSATPVWETSQCPNVVIAEGVKKIGDYFFYGCSSLLSVTISDGVTSIGKYAFSHCTGLTELTLPDSVTRIGVGAFLSCSNLMEINLAENLEIIEKQAFLNCKNLIGITIPANVDSIGDSAFSGCSNLSFVNWDDSYYKEGPIGQSAFSGCSSLISIVVPDFTSTGKGVFQNCTGLLTAKVIDGCVSLDEFKNCTSLTTLYLSKLEDKRSAFDGCSSLRDVYYADESDYRKQISLEEEFYENGGIYSETAYFFNAKKHFGFKDNGANGSIGSGLAINENLIILKKVGETFKLSATEHSEDVTYKVKWNSLDTNVATVGIDGTVCAVGEGDTFIVVYNHQTNSWDRCAVFVGSPNELNLYSEHDSRYYFGGDGFYSNTCQISNTVDIYMAMENRLDPRLTTLSAIPEFRATLSQTDLVDVKITATVSGEGLSFSENSYSNTFTHTYDKISAGKAIDDMIMLYPYNVEENAGEYTVTVKFESEYFEEFTETFTFTLDHIETKVIDDHIDFVNNNSTYRIYKIADFASQMACIDTSAEYQWARFTNLDFKNYYEVMFADVLLKLMDVKQTSIVSISPIIKEWVEIYKKTLKSVSRLVEEKNVEISESDFDKLIKKSNYTAKGKKVEDELRDAVVDVLSGSVSDKTINKCFAAVDKTGQISGLLKFGANTLKSIVGCINNISIINSYQEMENEFKEVIEYVYNQIPASEVMVKDAVGHFTGLSSSWNDDTFEPKMREISKVAASFSIDLYKYVLGSLLKDAVFKSIGNITLKSGVTLASTAGFNAFLSGYTLGICLSDFLCDTSGQAEEMGKLVAAAKFAPYVIKTLSYYETSMRAYKTVASVKRFENAFDLHKAVQTYCMEHTYETLRIQSTSLAIKLLEAANWYSSKNYVNTMNDIAARMSALSLCNCCLTDLEATKVTRTKTIAVKCPVDVYVYDEAGNEVVRIVNNIIEYCAYGISTFINGTEKYITVPATQDYSVKIVAFDDGVMSYSVSEYDETGERVSFVITENIALVDGKVFRGTINDDILPGVSAYNLKNGGSEVKYTENARTMVTGVELSETRISLARGNKKNLVATVTPNNASIDDIIWVSSDENIVAVDESGLCTAVKSGVATITATTKDGGYVAYCIVEVTDDGHNYTAVVTAPTCTDDGYTTYTCSDCGISYIAEKVSASGHSEETIAGYAPTCTKTGLTDGVWCSVCHEFFIEQTAIPTSEHKYSNGACVNCGTKAPITPDVPGYNFKFSIQKPSRIEINHRDGINLHANIEGTAPVGLYVVWTADNGNFKTTEIDNGNSLKIVSDKNGKTTFTATLYSADGKVLATESIEMNSKAGFFDKIISFFRMIFGGIKFYES